MTLDEAISHAEEKANQLGDCKCGEEHRELAAYLKELKQYRKRDEFYASGNEAGR